ncbi:MAG: bifunctional phosphopantothenoylcysteine decarboxylase/phosphopantothenate--cysteine ligase CoaBC [Methanolinea sp.]|jgi:phosphopantothenoylcysteine decarboxylase/phosphopantothenate--cysteine ligase|nr:bifunctional phosphopantothenoylcysteine decarboxylase/phosphopantothenate--cysteine ligase CoaBC [Methanolinea sp.]
MSAPTTLEGKEIVLAVTGSIAAVETIRLAHALRRRGAGVQAVMSNAACGILHPEALTYATGRPAITAITGMVEHVASCGEGGKADLLLIAPATANTLCKIASGIDDTPVTTFATTAIGRGMPVVVAPAMHESMFRHPGVAGCLKTLMKWGIVVVGPRIEEGKAKIAGIEEIILHCERELVGNALPGRHVLITSGPCQERVDDVRILTTRSRGMMGRSLAMQAFRLGARVTVVHQDQFPVVENVYASDANSMHREVMRICSTDPVDLFISAAAVSDFSPEPYSGKIPSGSGVTLTLRPLPKIIDQVVDGFHIPTLAFKLGDDAVTKGRTMVRDSIGLVVANDPLVMGKTDTRVTLLGRDGFTREISGPKDAIAADILNYAIEAFHFSQKD